jgi:hypothetical protein
MKRAIRGVALAALALATITGCSVHVDGNDAVTREFGSDFFGLGGVVNLTDTVAGDALIAGGRVSVASEVQGDLVVAGGELSLGGAVSDDLYAAGGSVQLDAIVSGNARIAGGEIVVGPATVVAGELSLGGGRVQFDGSTQGLLRASGGKVILNGEVLGDAEVRADELEIGPATRIGGRLVFHGPAAPEVPEGAVIAGGVEFHEGDARKHLEDVAPRVEETAGGIGSFLWLFGVFIAAAIYAALFPRHSREAAAAIGQRPLQSLGLGLAVLVCLPFVMILLMLTLVGIPLALLLIPLYLLLLFLGWATAALFVADRGLAVLRGGRPTTPAWRLFALFLGLLALWLIGKLPLFGGFLTFLALIAGIGALTWRLWSGRQAPEAPTPTAPAPPPAAPATA